MQKSQTESKTSHKISVGFPNIPGILKKQNDEITEQISSSNDE